LEWVCFTAPSFTCWIAGVCFSLLTGLFLLHREGLLHHFEAMEEVTNALQYRICLELLFGLPSPGAHTRNVALKISIFDGPNLLFSFGHSITLVQTEQ